jgi:hypothetical protein
VGTYRERADRFDARRRQLQRQANWVSHGRVAVFLSAALCLFLGWPDGGPARLWFVAAGMFAAIFSGLVWWFGRLRSQADRSAERCRINQHCLARMGRYWDRFPIPEVDVPPRSATLARDLDLFGRASLYHLVCVAHTPLGRRALRDWLVEPAEPNVIAERQAAVAELAPELDLRQELELLGRLAAGGEVDAGKFVAWAERKPWLARRRWLLWTARAIPVATLILVALCVPGMLPTWIWLVPVMLGIVVSFAFSGRVHSIFNLVCSRHGEIRRYSELFHLASQMPGQCAELGRIHRKLAGGSSAPYRRLSLLGRIMDLANFRFSPMVYLVVQGLTLWDFHVLWLVESWQRRSGGEVRAWFEALANLEALASLAGLAHDHPDWAFPKISPDGRQILYATGLGHPLLPDEVRVVNDVTVGPPGTLLLVTGSNMSGKSTLLRALGTDVALAQAGGPVCASQMELPPLVLATSMRIDDSLEKGESFFMAELHRLKEIVDLAVQTPGRPGKMVFYLLDEILQGTNTVERHIAVERVLSHLLAHEVIGAISTHDLDLATSPVLKEACRSVHFRESFHTENGIQRMTFDYKLHSGVATTTNALKLLEIVGLADLAGRGEQT